MGAHPPSTVDASEWVLFVHLLKADFGILQKKRHILVPVKNQEMVFFWGFGLRIIIIIVQFRKYLQKYGLMD